MRRLTIGDLGEMGLPVPDDGTIARLEADGRVPAIDAGDFVGAIRAGQISVVAGVRRFERRAVLCDNGTALEPDAVIAATGYRSDLGALVEHLGVLDARGLPVVHGGDESASAPRLYFVGFMDPRSGHLRELRLQAEQVARAVTSQGLVTECGPDAARRRPAGMTRFLKSRS